MAETIPQDATKKARPYKICTLWVHEESFSRGDVIFNASKFAECGIETGSLARIVAVQAATAVRDFQSTTTPVKENGTSGQRRSSTSGLSQAAQDVSRGADDLFIDENGVKVEGGRRLDVEQCYVFMAEDASAEMKTKSPTLHVSLSSHVANVFGFRRGMQVAVSSADEMSHTASHVEISFRDEYLARADMWRLTLALLGNKTVYKGQKLLFIGTIKATVKNIYVRGEKVRCAFYSTNSKPVFRSESARYVIFIQMSKEMWDFDADGSGDLMFNRVINGFLPDLLKRWVQMQARHLVSIILFTRVEYGATIAAQGNLPNFRKEGRPSKTGMQFQDFYRVVAMEMDSGEWLRILTMLKAEFKHFLQQVTTMKVSEQIDCGHSGDATSHKSRLMLAGEPTSAMRGNILEAINMAASQFSHDYIDRDLVRTGISIVIVTPGTGVYEVDYDMLKLTTDTLVGNGIGIDLVCLSRMPLHSVPLFKYRTPAILSMLTSSQMSQNPFEPGSTPRQSEPQIGSLTSNGFNGSPSKNSVLGSSPQRNVAGNIRAGLSIPPGSWSYALPHWIDVSFWTGSADQDLLLRRQSSRGTSRNGNHIARQGHTSFLPRCRMYELQNMGVMESEMSNISIPYLQEEAFVKYARNLGGNLNPLKGTPTPHATRDQLGSRNRQLGVSAVRAELDDKQIRRNSPSRGKTRDSAAFRWMDDYDENIFQFSERREKNKSSATHSSSHVAKAPATEPDTDAHMNDSPGGYGRSPASPHGPNKPTYFDRPMQRHSKELDTDTSRKEGTSSITLNQRPSRLSRQISLGPRGFGLAQASASTGLTIDTNKADKATTVTHGFAHGSPASPQTPRSVSRQIQASLSREYVRGLLGSRENSQKKENKNPSKPISIRSVQAHSEPRNPSTTAETSGSSSPVKQRSSTEGMGPIQVVSAANRVKPRITLSTSGGEREVPNTLSPVSAMSPWLTLLNPSNPRKENMSIASQFRRWQHVFPRPVRTSAIKWKSLCSPAAVPLTMENFPSLHQLTIEYRENPYKLTQNDDDDLFEIPRTRQALVRELIAFRLSHGFQLVVGAQASAAAGRPPSETVNIFDQEFMTTDGSTVFMSLGNTIHQLVCAAGGEIEVKRFQRKPTTAVAPSFRDRQGESYKPLIRTMVAEDYEAREISLRRPEPELNWNYVDNFLAGWYEDFSDILRFWRARFVLIPVEIPSRRPLPLVSEDSEEEIRLEGIRKLTQMWQKHRFVPLEERRYQAPLRTTKDENPLAIEYQTRDPSAVVAAGVENSLLIESDSMGAETQLFSEQDLYHQSNVDLQKLAQDIQSERGIPVMDRRWHLRLHYNCFVGSDLVSWLLKYFKDVETRDDAVELGNNLMQKGLFQHVQQKHTFRDGNFFFQIATDYRRRESRASWFGGRRTVPSTPSVETSRGTPFGDYPRVKTPAEDSPSGSGNKTPTKVSSTKPKVALSRVLRFDVDTRKRSYRPEMINLHYDRLHNPDNCYHIRIDWMNVTAKLIEDTIVTWATTAERYGLRLVELPIAEACRVSETHPFRSPYIIELALQPPEPPLSQSFDVTSFTPLGKPDKFAYHKALLKHLGFVLDMESKDSFPSDVDVTYSWGKPDYQLTQYVHKSGVAVVQITEKGNFLLLANRLCNNRAAAGKEAGKYDKADNSERRPTTAAHGVDRGSPFSSPLVRALSDHPPLAFAFAFKGNQKVDVTAEQLKEEIENLCCSTSRLRAFYDEALKPSASPSPGITPILEPTIPSLGLPPSILGRDGAASPVSRHAASTDGLSVASNDKEVASGAETSNGKDS
ncbi:hypothetical protein EV356DRAFT_438368 [Viridothelium virens]|uniref:Vacuolar membrane-associated protein IML1 n=1 Tax=Viridothelium virens TaxID=1048519 RepID=A0A6A6HRH3_VIRVR|nr:hypothetical protein EV356DRAFT_438368 [Viridothelium virens]